jgi:hypothetical protein
MTSGVRFWPPSGTLTAELRWVLERAFGNEQQFTGLTATPKSAITTARALGLLPRIFSRVEPKRLERELSDSHAVAILQYRTATAGALALERAVAGIDDAAAVLEADHALIKGSALIRSKVVPLARRGACDVDVLVEATRAEDFHRTLQRRGFVPRNALDSLYHLPGLSDGAGGIIEIHRSIPDLNIPRPSTDVTFSVLQRESLLKPAPGLSKHAHVPVRDLMVAHAIAHGIVHHGFLPLTYPLMKMMADLIDLGVSADTRIESRIVEWLDPAISEAELAAIVAATRALVDCQFESIWHGDEPSSRLLRHCVLGSIDRRYARGLWPHYYVYARRAQLRALGSRRFAEQIWHRIRDRTEAVLRLGWREYQRQYGVEARGHDFAEFRWSSLPAAGQTLWRAVRGRLLG